MNWTDLNFYFEKIPEGSIGKLFENPEFPWSPLAGLEKAITAYFDELNSQGSLQGERFLIKKDDGSLKEGGYFIKGTEVLEKDFIDKELHIFIGKGTFIEGGSTIKNNTIISSNCEIRQGAYIRGNVYVGSHSVVGHTTEIKNSIFIHHVEAGHFAYIGDSIIGSYVNLGAGTKLSNLEFRTLEQKQTESFPILPFQVEKEPVITGLSKLGAIIGDGCETGCNSVLSPLVLLQKECWILPNLCVAKGVYPEKSFLVNAASAKRKRL
ncbi:MAG: NDP-sugar pyrophosphorylase family protein [bacterium]|jgi:NDP-sugar pyrophosphorylase family protein